MKRRRPPILAVTVLGFSLMAALVRADEHADSQLSVTVAFGAGLNTTGAANHHVLPPEITIKAGGVVNFATAGFHQIFVYLPGKTADDVVVPPTGMFIDDLDNLYYAGLSPIGTPLGFSNAQNRTSAVIFSTVCSHS